MLVAIAVLITIAAVVFTLSVRSKDVPPPPPPSPTAHLEERKAAVYENLRDLQFEYRVGKLSDEDYQQTKLDLQKELAAVLAEIDRIEGVKAPPASQAAPVAAPAPAGGTACPKCGAQFVQALKFCGECGSPMTEARA